MLYCAFPLFFTQTFSIYSSKMSNKKFTFLAPLMVFVFLVLQITPSDARKYKIRERDLDKHSSTLYKRADCSFWLNGLHQFQQTWDDGKSELNTYGYFLDSKPGNDKPEELGALKFYYNAKPLLDRSMNGYGCADLGSCKDYWNSFKKAVEGNYVTREYYVNFQQRCDSKVADLLTCSENFFTNGICDNCRCKR